MKSIKRPMLLVAVFFCGWLFASVTNTPNNVFAGGVRPSISALLATIDSIINGGTIVGQANFADNALFADDAFFADNANFADEASFAFSAQDAFFADTAISADTANNAFFADNAFLATEAESLTNFVAPTGNSGSCTNVGEIQFNPDTQRLEYCNGAEWVALAIEP